MARVAMAALLAWLAPPAAPLAGLQAPTAAPQTVADDGGAAAAAEKVPDGLTDPRAEPLPIRDIGTGEIVTWATDQVRRPLRLRADGVTLTIRTMESRLGDLVVQPQILVEAPGLPSALINGSDARMGYEHAIGIGRLHPDGPRFVYYQGYTGGMHCCLVLIVAVVGPAGIDIAELGSWDGGPTDHFPRDVNGDGIVDFVQRDDRFRYAFGGGGASYGPPQIFNFRDSFSEPVDVSMEPAFRPLFMEQMREARQGCIAVPADPQTTNAECAVYVASAARVGRLDQAWREMLRIHTDVGEFDLPRACRFTLRARQRCPAGAEILFTNYADALRHFLRETGYIAL